MRADLEDVNQHADVLEDGRALGEEVRVHERVLAAAVPGVEDEIAEEADVVLLDVNCRTEAGSERCGVVRARKWTVYTLNSAALVTRVQRGSETHKMRERMEVFPLPDAPMRRT